METDRTLNQLQLPVTTGKILCAEEKNTSSSARVGILRLLKYIVENKLPSRYLKFINAVNLIKKNTPFLY
ncbi:hypothetical protein scyTo_0003316 [Scyliorhinus torazame]|uniref:Uncharacterized protein n=1 Tax=Scyliorhinus torazame TaxID=75743 RepID=A0A401PM92_SCYTO|nr:hypothetical protein [Scyliorhinus torazame]